MVAAADQTGRAPLPHVLFVRATTAATLHPWLDDFVDEAAAVCEVHLYDAAKPLPGQFETVRAVVDLGGFGGHELIDAGRDAGVQLWQVLGYGLDHLDVDYVLASGIPLAHTPGSCTAVPLAEHALHLMLNLEKQWRASQAVLASARYGGPFSGELDGQTLGLVGFGASGRALAARAHAFGMRVLALDAVRPADDDPAAAGCEYVGGIEALDDLLGASDYVSLHLPLTDETHHLLDARAIARMKPGAVIVNVARGKLIDQDALVEALRSGALRGACLDVYEEEPLPPTHPLVGLAGAVLTPHTAGLTRPDLAAPGALRRRQRRPCRDRERAARGCGAAVRGDGERPRRNTLTWLGQAGFVLELDGLRVLVDPFTSDHEARLHAAPDEESLATGVDWLLVTHEHLDHFDAGFVRALDRYSPGAGLVVPSPLVEEAAQIAPGLTVVGVRPGDRKQLSGSVSLHVTPAWHGIEPKDGYSQGFVEDGGSRFVGFVVGTADVSIYHSGDTIVTDELRAALAGEQIDVALLPINGRDYYRESLGLVGNMDAREALALARELGVRLLVPMHWDLFAGNTVRPGALVDEASLEADVHVLVPARHVPLPLPGPAPGR